MPSLSGRITDKLAKIFKPGAKAYNPGRPADVKPKRGAVPKGVQGHQLGGKPNRKKK